MAKLSSITPFPQCFLDLMFYCSFKDVNINLDTHTYRFVVRSQTGLHTKQLNLAAMIRKNEYFPVVVGGQPYRKETSCFMFVPDVTFHTDAHVAKFIFREDIL